MSETSRPRWGNVRDFPEETLAPLCLRALHPDDLLMELAAVDPGGVVSAVRSLIAVKRRPPRTMEEELAGLRVNMLDRFADFIEQGWGRG